MTSAGLRRAITSALDARARLGDRPVAETAAALAAAARRWAEDAALADALAASSVLDPTMVAAVLPIAAAALDADAMTALAARERGDGGAAPSPIVHVLASNVPALALPAVALGLLAGAAVVVKSGRRDSASAPAFQRALARVDPPLAATVLPVAWPRGSDALDDVLLDAPLAVVTGEDATVRALAARASGRVLGYGTRHSALLLDAAAPIDFDAAARDVVLYEQRGCLSPHTAFVVGDAPAVASGLAAALERAAHALPPAQASVEERAAVRAFLDEREWAGAAVTAGAWGAVVVEREAVFRSTCGARTLRVVAIERREAVAAALPRDRVECLGTNVPPPHGLFERGVARVCPLGRMQAPRLSWPRGQRPPLASLLRADAPPAMEIELEVAP